MSDIAIPYDIEPHPLTRMFNGKFGTWLFLASEVMLFGAFFSTYVLLRVEAPAGTWPMHGLADTHSSQILNVPLATINTMVLIASSVSMVMAWAALKMKEFGKGRKYLLLTFALAGTFLVIKFFEYKSKLTHYQVELTAPLLHDGEEISKTITVGTEGGERTYTTLSGHLGEETEDYVMFAPDSEHGHGAEIRIDRTKIERLSRWGPANSAFLATYFTMTGLHGLHIIGGMVVILYLIVTGGRMWKERPEKYVNRVECTGLYWHFVDLVWIFLFPTLYLL
ncbi:MAG: heme-copper oxidase subunit III [Phycisphaerae bacterium]